MCLTPIPCTCLVYVVGLRLIVILFLPQQIYFRWISTTEKQGGSQRSKGANKATRLLQGLLWSEATWATATKRGYLAFVSPAFDSWLCCLLAVQCEQIKDLSEPQTLST